VLYSLDSSANHNNYSFFWPILKKGIAVDGPAVDAISSQFGSFDKFKDDFSTAARLLFGSGWTWLVLNGRKLEIVTTPNSYIGATCKSVPADVW